MNEKDATEWRRAYELVGGLLELDDNERRARMADLADEPETVRRRVASLMRADEASGGVLENPPEIRAGSMPKPGTVIGSWQIDDEIGRGGMGLVYRASRKGADFTQRGALKLLRVGMLDAFSVSRFRREQQILADLQHPNIASLIDGGVTEDGTPFLVMEEVQGEPIDAYCESHRLDVSSIVGLMLQIVDAAAFAHRRLVVHRDIKPANLLVDGDGRSRLLDFGIAKLLDDGGPATTATRILTPGYGAPEQLSGETVTTATDVFGLGAVLYRLLARASAFDDTGANRVSVIVDTPVAPSRHSSAVSGVDSDLDNIVMMAIRPEPERRYAGAEALAADLRRWLDGRPVEATPDRLGYRLRKTMVRHRPLVAAGLIALMALLAGSGVALWQAAVARQESERARASAEEATRQLRRAEAVTDFLVTTVAAADPSSSGGRDVTVRAVLEQGSRRIDRGLESQPETRRRLRSVFGEISYLLGDLERAERMLTANLETPGGSVESQVRDLRFAARSAMRAGDHALAEQRFDEAFLRARDAARIEQLQVELDYAALLIESQQSAIALERLDRAANKPWFDDAQLEQRANLEIAAADALAQLGRLEEAKVRAEQGVALYASIGDENPLHLAGARGVLANIEVELGNLTRAVDLKTSVLETQVALLGPRHPNTLVSQNDLATLQKNLGRFGESAKQLEALLERQREVFGDTHPNIATTLFNLGQARFLAADVKGAVAAYRDAVARVDAAPEDYGARRGVYHAVFGHCLAATSTFEDAEREMRLGLGLLVDMVGDTHPLTARIRVRFAERLNDRGRHAEAGAQTDLAIPVLERVYGPGSRELALAQLERGRALSERDPQMAMALLERGLEALEESPFRLQLVAQIEKAETRLRALEAVRP